MMYNEGGAKDMLKKKKRNILSMKNSMNRNTNKNTMQRNPIKLKKGDEGDNVKRMQEMILDIVEFYPSIPRFEIDGVYGEDTMMAVKRFQELMGIYDTGNMDLITWNKLQLIHCKKNALECNVRSKIEKEDENKEIRNKIKEGSSGKKVIELQEYINKVSNIFPSVPKVKIDGIFGNKTKEAVIIFQRMFNLEIDGIVGEITFTTLYNASLGKIVPHS